MEYSTAGLRSNVSVTILGECAICETATTLRCQACLKGGNGQDDVPFYCSREHQMKHWKAGHKTSCGQRPSSSLGWKLEKEKPCPLGANVSENMPYFVATSDLKTGHVLFQRKPLLAYPAFPNEIDQNRFLNKMPPFVQKKVFDSKEPMVWTCVGCYELLLYGEIIQTPRTGLTINKCLSCGWPVHSHVHKSHGGTKCQSLHERECSILVEKGLIWDTLRKENVYNGAEMYTNLGIIRALLLPPGLKEELMKLPVSFSPEPFPPEWSKKMIPFIRDRCGFGDKISEVEVQKILLIMFGNVFHPTPRISSKTKLAFVIWQGGPTGRVMPHDCTPNCNPYIDNNLVATFKTIRNVQSGQLLNVNYIRIDCFGKPVNERLFFCSQMLMQACRCKRCRSSDEGGTFFSAIKCPMDKKSGDGKRDCQYLLPEPNPNPDNGISDAFVWRCGCKMCTGASRQNAVEKLVATIREKIETAVAGPHAYDELKSLLAKTAGRTVHPNHSIIFYALLNIASLATREISNVESNKNPEFDFTLHKKYLKDVDAVVDRLQEVQPGRNEYYGMFLFHQTLLKMSLLAENVTKPETRPSFEDLEKELESTLLGMKESWIIINDNPTSEPYDTAREANLRKFYANHLISAILQGYGEDVQEKVNNFKLLKEKYYSSKPVNLDMSEDELQYRQLITVNDSLPELLKRMNLV